MQPRFVGGVGNRQAPLGRDVYQNLAAHARALGVDEKLPWLLVGRGGVERSLLKAQPHARGYSIEDLYAEPNGTRGRAPLKRRR
jgi:hypothetical protein